MSIADWDPAACNGAADDLEKASGEFVGKGNRSAQKNCAEASGQPLHRLAAVRRQQGITQRNMARRLGTDVQSVCEQEQETADLALSVLYAWQKILDVPVADLLVETNDPLSAPVLERARLVKLMKTAAAIMEKAQTNSIKRLVTMLVEQLLEIMPELHDVAAWHTVGQRRTLDDYGRAVERQLPDDLLRRLPK